MANNLNGKVNRLETAVQQKGLDLSVGDDYIDRMTEEELDLYIENMQLALAEPDFGPRPAEPAAAAVWDKLVAGEPISIAEIETLDAGYDED